MEYIEGLTPSQALNTKAEKQIFDCLTSDVTNHSQLKTKLISRYGKETQINATFRAFGF
jgi:hypothetical protein